MSFDHNHISTFGTYAGKMVRYSFYAVGTIVLALIGMVVIRVTSFFDQPSRVSTKASFQINSPELTRLSPTANSARFNAGWQEILQYGQGLRSQHRLHAGCEHAGQSGYAGGPRLFL